MNDTLTKSCNRTGSLISVFRTIFNLCFINLGKIVLISLHSVFRFIFSLENSFRNLPVKGVFRTNIESEFYADVIRIHNEVSFYNKVPQHLTLIVGDEHPSYKDFVNIIKWSIPAGISHISFYDHNNGINSDKLFSYVCKYAKNYIPLIKWGKSFSEEIKHNSKNQINGFSWSPTISVHVIKEDDWSSALLQCLEEMSVSGCELVSVSKLDTLLRKSFQAPDPDLAIVAGSVLSFFGFPPWFLRITQIQKVSSHHNFSLPMFLENLNKFSISEQRYGK